MRMQLPMGLSARGGGGSPPVDYVALMSALLAGTTGWVTDPADASTLFTDTGGTTPVTTPGVDLVARQNSKFGTTTYNWQNATTTQQFLWNGASMEADGVDDQMSQGSTWSYAANLSAMTYTARARIDSLAAARTLHGWSTGVANSRRFNLGVNADGSVTVVARRLDADAQQVFTSATGLITTGVDFTLQFSVDFAGTGEVKAYLNGTDILTGTLSGAPGNSENTNSARDRRGLNTSNTLNDYFRNKLGCEVFFRGLATAQERADMRGFVERNPL